MTAALTRRVLGFGCPASQLVGTKASMGRRKVNCESSCGIPFFLLVLDQGFRLKYATVVSLIPIQGRYEGSTVDLRKIGWETSY